MYQKVLDDIRTDYYQSQYPNDGQRFVAWYLRNIHNLDTFEAKDCITDGAGDKQIDAIYIDNQASVVYIIQGKYYSGDVVDVDAATVVVFAYMTASCVVLHEVEYFTKHG